MPTLVKPGFVIETPIDGENILRTIPVIFDDLYPEEAANV